MVIDGAFYLINFCSEIALLFVGVLLDTMSSTLTSNCCIRTASSSSRIISSFHGNTVHVAIAISVGISKASLVISSTSLEPDTELCVLRSTHSTYGSICGQFFTLPSHAFASALTIGLWPRSIFPLASGLYAMVSVSKESNSTTTKFLPEWNIRNRKRCDYPLAQKKRDDTKY